jgi:hypothetical protein
MNAEQMSDGLTKLPGGFAVIRPFVFCHSAFSRSSFKNSSHNLEV